METPDIQDIAICPMFTSVGKDLLSDRISIMLTNIVAAFQAGAFWNSQLKPHRGKSNRAMLTPTSDSSHPRFLASVAWAQFSIGDYIISDGVDVPCLNQVYTKLEAGASQELFADGPTTWHRKRSLRGTVKHKVILVIGQCSAGLYIKCNGCGIGYSQVIEELTQTEFVVLMNAWRPSTAAQTGNIAGDYMPRAQMHATFGNAAATAAQPRAAAPLQLAAAPPAPGAPAAPAAAL